VELLKAEIRKTYSSVSREPGKDFIFPAGRACAEDLTCGVRKLDPCDVQDARVAQFAGETELTHPTGSSHQE
jgi:hypothetical protein